MIKTFQIATLSFLMAELLVPARAASPVENAGYSAAVIESSKPSLYWEFNETSGPAKNTVSGSKDGVSDAAAFGGAGPRPVDGLLQMPPENTSVGFERAGTVKHPSLKTGVGIPTDTYTVQGWFLSTVPSSSSAVQNIFGRGNSTGEARDTVGVGGTWNLSPVGKLYFYEPVTGKVVAGTTMLAPNRWYHVVLVRDGTNVRVYLNGQLEIDAQKLGWPGGDGEQFAVGNRADYPNNGQPAYGLKGFVDEVGVWNRPLESSEVSRLFSLSGFTPPPPAFALFVDAETPQPSFLAQGGKAQAVIVVGKESDPFYRWVAGELQRYLRDLTGAELPIMTHDEVPADKPLLIVGGPNANPLSATAGEKKLADFAGLKPEGFIVQTVSLAGHPAVLIGGNDEASTMYAAYQFLEGLGLAFQITGDILPQQRPDLKLPADSVRMEPDIKHRGLHMRHFVMPWMGLDDFRTMIDQMAKLKMNYLEFYWYLGGPWDEYSYRGEKRRIEEQSTKDSSFLTWHLTAGPNTADDVKIGRDLFKQERVVAPEFAKVQNQDDAHKVAREWLREAIAYAHKRKIKVWLGQGDCPQVVSNFKKFSPLATEAAWGFGAMPPGDSVGAEIWEAMFDSMVETYPEADGYWLWLAEVGVGNTATPETQKVLRQYDVDGKAIHNDSDLALIHYGREMMTRLKARHPNVKFGLSMLARCSLFQTLDKYVPKDVAFASMESGACFHKGIPVPMENFGGLGARETFLIPRMDDDVHELAMQFNVGLYEFDRVLAGSAQYDVSGVIPQVGRLRGLEQNARYLADGSWESRLTSERFYESYLLRLFGGKAFPDVSKAYQILQENERLTEWQGYYNFVNYCGPLTFDLSKYQADPLTAAAAPPVNWSTPGMNRAGFSAMIPRLNEALGHLEKARSKALPGSLGELDYVIFKTESYILHLKTLCAWLDGIAAYDRVVEVKNWNDNTALEGSISRCKDAFLRARDVTHQSAGLIADKAKHGDDKYILFRYNFGLVTPIDELCGAMEKWTKPGDRK